MRSKPLQTNGGSCIGERAVKQIMEVLKLCVVQGVQACNLGVPILADELADRSND